MKRKHIFLIILAAVLLCAIAADFLINPIKGHSYDLLDINKDQITAVEIHHYGKGLTVTDPEVVAQLISQLDCSLERRGNDYFTNRTGGDWSITFLTSQGKQSKSFLFFPGSGYGETQMKIGHYYYAADKNIDSMLLRELFFDPTISGKEKEIIETAYLDYFSDALGTQVQSLEGILSLESTTDGRVHLYYGTFQDTVVWLYGRPGGDAVSLELAGSTLSYPTFCEFLAAKGGQCYSLSDAYRMELLSAEDIAVIAQRHARCNQALLATDRPVSAGEEAQLSFSELSVSSQVAAQVSQAYTAYLEKAFPSATIAGSEDGTLPGRYYGTFGDAVVWFEDTTTEAEVTFEIANIRFWNPSGCAFYAYKEGNIYSLAEAYLQGYLSVADVALVAQRHTEAVNASVLHSPEYFFDKTQYTTVAGFDGDVIYSPLNKDDLEYMMTELLDGENYGLIAACTVVGGSYNQIVLQDSYTYSLSHICTPIRIDHIFSKGSLIDISEGELCYLHENYFYITEQLPELAECYGENSVYLKGADPVVNGQQYIMYLYDLERPPVPSLGFGGKKLLSPVSKDLYAFPIGTKEEAEQVLLEPDDTYWATWEAVLQSHAY